MHRMRLIERVCSLDRIRTRLAVEAGSSFGCTGIRTDGGIISMDLPFGASAPAENTFQEFGFTVENVVERAMRLVKR
jgi:transketolase